MRKHGIFASLITDKKHRVLYRESSFFVLLRAGCKRIIHVENIKEGDVMAYLSDTIDVSKLRRDQFNLIASGCGTGKSHWVMNRLLADLGDIRPCEAIFVTSRSITRDQQARNAGIDLINSDIVDYWNEGGESHDCGLTVMTYDRLANILKNGCGNDAELLQNVKVVVFDECHTLFCDLFINGIYNIQQWIREVIYRDGKMFIGLTATPAIINADGNKWGIPVANINDDVVTRYKAKHLIYTDFRSIPHLVEYKYLSGRTMIMCRTIAECFKLQDQMQNAAVLISPHNKRFTKEMRQLRNYIIKNESLPGYFDFINQDGSVEKRPLDVFIATSTLREGFNLRESSGVKNVISCISDELHITQFAGRCRYNLDNLVVAYTTAYTNKENQSPYLLQSGEKFKPYIDNKECTEWFESISHLVEHDINGVRRFFFGTDDIAFKNYINKTWLVPEGNDVARNRIWKKEDKESIAKVARQCRLFKLWPYQVTYTRVIKLMQDELGYVIKSKRANLSGSKRTYKLVISHDASAETYVPAYKTVIEGFDP